MVSSAESRARPRAVWLVGFMAAGLLYGMAAGAGSASAQVPEAAADSVAPDTVLIPIPPQDTPPDTLLDVAQETVQETEEPALPPPVPVLFPTLSAGGWSTASWEWTREQLLALPAMTALEFIERLPGITRFRAGNFGRPEGITAMGMGGSRTRVFLDGFELDPFGAGAYELETLPLLELASVRVDRSLMEIRVDVRTYQLDQAEAHSVVELGTGVYKTRLLRAIFSRGVGTKSTFTGSYDLVNTRGIGLDEPYSHGGNAVRWTYVPFDRLSIQAEWRRGKIDRERAEYPTQTSRSDLLLRVRSPLSPGLVVEGFAGRTSVEEELTGAEDDRKAVQAGARAAFSNALVLADVSGRIRSATSDYPLLPSRELEGNVAISPASILRVEGNGRVASWGGGSASSARLKGVVSPVQGISLFGALEVGSRPLTGFEEIGSDTLATLVASDGGGWRGGVELARGSASLGAALFGSSLSSVAPFGLPFDRGLLSIDTDNVTGAEFYGRLPIWRAVSVEGWYSRINDAEGRPYTPDDIGRVIISATGSYYSDQLEPTLLIEGIHRGGALVPDLEGERFGVRAAPYQTLDLSLRIRIIDVEAYLLWNNLLANRHAIDMPWATPSIQRIVYGARWSFQG